MQGILTRDTSPCLSLFLFLSTPFFFLSSISDSFEPLLFPPEDPPAMLPLRSLSLSSSVMDSTEVPQKPERFVSDKRLMGMEAFHVCMIFLCENLIYAEHLGCL